MSHHTLPRICWRCAIMLAILLVGPPLLLLLATFGTAFYALMLISFGVVVTMEVSTRLLQTSPGLRHRTR